MDSIFLSKNLSKEITPLSARKWTCPDDFIIAQMFAVVNNLVNKMNT